MKRYRHTKRPGTRESELEHRQVWMDAYGPIPEGCIIHHRNENTRDNRLENLELMTHRQHAVHHNEKHPRTKECVICGVEFTPHITKRERAQTCSPACRRELSSRRAYERYASNVERDRQIRKLADGGMPKNRIAALYNLSPASITRITKPDHVLRSVL